MACIKHPCTQDLSSSPTGLYIYVAVNFLFQLIFVFPLFVGMVMHANEFETKEKQKLTEIKNKLQHIYIYKYLYSG